MAMKKDRGYPLRIFADFVVKDHCTYDFKEVLHLDFLNT
jgi:hypothetical protein